MSSHSAECFYLKCEQCDVMGCACLCHRRRSNFYERIKQEESRSVILAGDRGRGRPRKLRDDKNE